MAAKYLGRSVSTFREEVKIGLWPTPFRKGFGLKRTSRLWDRLQLDRELEAAGGANQRLTKSDKNSDKNLVREGLSQFRKSTREYQRQHPEEALKGLHGFALFRARRRLGIKD